MRLLPLEVGGEFARGLESCREAALLLHRALNRTRDSPLRFRPSWISSCGPFGPKSASESSARARRIFDAAAEQTCTWPSPASPGHARAFGSGDGGMPTRSFASALRHEARASGMDARDPGEAARSRRLDRRDIG